MTSPPVLFLHGFGASPSAFETWRARLREAGVHDHHALAYDTRSNDIDLHDLAEALERAVRSNPTLASAPQIDLVVHSTGMLVALAWLYARPERRDTVRFLVGLAPATHGSHLAHLGRGMLAALGHGSLEPGPDLLEGGDRLLTALELASRDTWELASAALHPSERTLLACGIGRYAPPRRWLHEQGGDGVVRLAGCDPAAPCLTVDLTHVGRERLTLDGRPTGRQLQRRTLPALQAPLVVLPDHHHGSILRTPPRFLTNLVSDLFQGRCTPSELQERARHLRSDALRTASAETLRAASCSQLIIRVEDERGRPVPDYYVDLLVPEGATPASAPRAPNRWRSILHSEGDVQVDVHVHRNDRSRRAFHLSGHADSFAAQPLALRIVARSGTPHVGYTGYRAPLDVTEPEVAAPWDGLIDLTPAHAARALLAPRTTTRILVRLERQPLPPTGVPHLARFDPRG